MCAPLSPHGEIKPSYLLKKADAAFEALNKAISALHVLTSNVATGTIAAELTNGDSDDRIKRATRAVAERHAEWQQALCSLMVGEHYANRITTHTLGVEIQARIARNEHKRGVRTGYPAVVSPAGA